MNRADLIYRHKLQREKLIRLCLKNFYVFCRAQEPTQYTNHRTYLKTLCNTLQDFYEGKLLREDGKPYKKLIINLPPRHYKTRTLTLFLEWMLGVNPQERLMVTCYNDKFANDLSRYTRDGIKMEKGLSSDLVYSEIFPNSVLKHGDSSVERWALDGQFFNCIASGLKGSITGKGATKFLADDLIKSALEAFNPMYLDSIYDWYTNTAQQRLEQSALEIINFTRWSEDDLVGKILRSDNAYLYYVLKLPACKNEETGEMLSDDILDFETYKSLKVTMDPQIHSANYQQEPFSREGALYSSFKTYSSLPSDLDSTIFFCDTADSGDNYLAGLVVKTKNRQAWVTDVIYTQAGMEITEPKVAELLYRNRVNLAKIERNNGGKGFERAIKKIMDDEYKDHSTIFKGYHQTLNKEARLLANSNYVMQNIFWPEFWSTDPKWKPFYEAMKNHQRQGKNRFDDAPDVSTQVAEHIQKLGATTRIS